VIGGRFQLGNVAVPVGGVITEDIIGVPVDRIEIEIIGVGVDWIEIEVGRLDIEAETASR
jgi:hypothetical protein